MSEEQRKPAKNLVSKPLPYLLILIVLMMLAGIFIMIVGGHLTPTKNSVYNTAKTELQNAVKDYQNQNNGALPTINGTVTINGSAYEIINICSLLASQGGTLKYLPDSCISINGSDNDNCDAGCEGCWEYSHYVWSVDDEGNVYSTCVGEYCNASGVNGYQDVWP